MRGKTNGGPHEFFYTVWLLAQHATPLRVRRAQVEFADVCCPRILLLWFPQTLELTSRSTTAFTNTKCCFCVRTGQVKRASITHSWLVAHELNRSCQNIMVALVGGAWTWISQCFLLQPRSPLFLLLFWSESRGHDLARQTKRVAGFDGFFFRPLRVFRLASDEF